MTDSAKSMQLRSAVPVLVGILIGMNAGKAASAAVLPAFGYWGALLVNMLTAAAVSVLVAMPLVYYLGRRQTKG
ncbi:MAG TPA: hypothetical protein VM165_08370 [Planctomycetaceae bacterium]|nr:hypothetical protein [Planctomycetaceae bacterium]